MDNFFNQAAALIALSGILFTAVLTFWSSRRNAYLTLIIAERAKWTNQLRENVAEILSQLATIHYIAVEREAETKKYSLELRIAKKQNF